MPQNYLGINLRVFHVCATLCAFAINGASTSQREGICYKNPALLDGKHPKLSALKRKQFPMALQEQPRYCRQPLCLLRAGGCFLFGLEEAGAQLLGKGRVEFHGIRCSALYTQKWSSPK